MKELLLKIAGVKTEEAFYKKYPTQSAFFKAHPEAKEIIAKYQQQEMMEDDSENSEEQMMDREEDIEEMANGGNVPTNPALWSRAKAAAKSKYDVYPSAYANGFAAKWYKEKGGGWKKAAMGGYVDEYADGGGINNPGFKALPKSVQENIIANMAMGGMVDSYYYGGGINNKGFKALPKAVQENIISNMSMGGEVEEYADGGGIPQRYKNMGFTKVGQKKQGDGKHKWKVLAKKGDSYKVVQGGWRGMEDFKQHKSEKRRDNFWSRMGGKNSAKAQDPFSPLYWHKRFGTWADGGILPDVEQLMLAGQGVYEMGGMVEYPTYYPGGGMVGSDMIDYQADYNYPTMYPGGGMIAGPMMGYEDMFEYAMGGGININPANEGKFTEWAQKRGMTVQEAANKVMANRSKYTADVVKMANFAKNAAGWKKAMGGRIYEEGGMLNSMTEGIPVQTETFEGQAEQVALPDGTIKSVEATTSHENMSDNTVTDLLPGGSHIQSARNKLTPDQYIQLMQMFKPETADQDIKKLSQVYQSKYGKKNGKKLSPADISEYAKNKYQNKSTPNSFDTDKLKEGNKKAYLDLSMQMNDLIKSGKELAEGAMLEEQMMAYGGMIPQYAGGTNSEGITITMYPGGKSRTPTGQENKYNKDASYLTQWESLIPGISKYSNQKAQEAIYDYTLKNNPDEIRNMWNTYGLTAAGLKDPIFRKKYGKGVFDANKLSTDELKELRRAYADKFFGARQLENKPPITPATTPTTPVVAETPAQKAEKQMLSQNTPIAPAARIPMQNRFNFGLLEGQLGRGLGANEAVLAAGLAQNPLYIMETPDTYIRSRKNEIPVGNILYNIEKAQRNTANALADQTGDWSTLAGNIANAGAQAYNQLGDTLSKLNQTNVALYNETQGLQQDLLGSNMGVRNQNLTNMQNMLNFKRNLFGQKAVKDSEIYSEYAKSMGENAQKEQNQKLEMLNIMASKPDMFKGEQGQMFANQILGNTGSYNNAFAGTLLDNILSFNRYKR